MSRAPAFFSRALLLSAAGLLCLAALATAQATTPGSATGSSSRSRAPTRIFEGRGPTRYEAQILAFEAADALRPPAPGGIVFVGSSTIRLWPDLAEDFPGLPVVQRGFGGAKVADLIHYADRIVVAYRPRIVVILIGCNDLAVGLAPEEVLERMRLLVEKLHAELPETHVCYISINPTVARWRLQPKIERTNRLLSELISERPWMTFIDSASSLRGADGRPLRRLLSRDQLHLNAAGYRLLASVVRPEIERLWALGEPASPTPEASGGAPPPNPR